MCLPLVLRWGAKIVLILSLLSACGYKGSEYEGKLDFPALPIIQRAVDSLVPTFNGQRNDAIMNMVCALARGQKSQEQISQLIKEQGVDLSKVPPQGHSLSIFVNNDSAQMKRVCAAYVATSVMMIPKLSEITVDVDPRATVNNAVSKVDPIKLDQLLSRRLAVAKANEDIYALIAYELGKNQGGTLGQYEDQATHLFGEFASVYLRQVRDLAESERGQRHILMELTDRVFKFDSSSGYRFELGYDGLHLGLNRIPWFGGSVILGKDYRLKVDYFDAVFLDPDKLNARGRKGGVLAAGRIVR